ncbi:DUF523 domain-containing protein [Streptococcus chenjunshii]|uniref:DUF523 domain-containing protein n=1 Tax=Streptococcus chenjunshii TaxID=2173853 RepID=A0A372KMK6_9STRE|nr:DUF523 domain-containing protein [Streptococcus chenjunshii]AXQ77652.1 DUF523 domain-containing protein [Streptococcus chenjunshii]RFU50635.1 DUF523 domain-containing protein [Streptococcus chenjunshii]RFU52808.1 DUF523 domain-containing protein [Streptococcus chenjunshii]
MENKSCILVSACLLGENCKYNGGNNYNQQVVDFVSDKEVIAVCPEVAGGLPVPRKPVELSGGHVLDAEGKVYDKPFQDGIARTLACLEGKRVDLAVLQSRSPSCGVHQIYDGSFSGKKKAGSGLFAQKLKDLGYQVLDAEDMNQMKGKR